MEIGNHGVYGCVRTRIWQKGRGAGGEGGTDTGVLPSTEDSVKLGCSPQSIEEGAGALGVEVT